MTGSWSTTDLCDAHEALFDSGELQVVQGAWQWFGARRAFAGPVQLLQVFEDNSLVGEALRKPGHGAVLVVDGAGSLRCALVGGNLAQSAAANGWAGILVHGAVRDRAELDSAQVGICALGLCPRRSVKRGQGLAGVAVRFGGATLRAGMWIYADADGVIGAARDLTAS